MGGNCHQKGKERGSWYEIKCVKDIIISKEAKNQDASMERNLLKSWANYPGYEDAAKGI